MPLLFKNLLKAFIDPLTVVLLLIIVAVLVLIARRKRTLGLLSLIFTFFILYGASVSPISDGLCYILEKDYFRGNEVSKPDIIVVLGGGIVDASFLKITLPSRQSASRILYAVQMFRKNQPDYLICAGGGDGRLKEAEVMRNEVVRLGVPQDKIKLDMESQNTREHAENLNRMFQDKKLRIGLVTSAYHMKRSEREFKKYFPYLIPLPSDYLYSPPESVLFKFWPTSARLYKTSTALREIIALVWYKIGKD